MPEGPTATAPTRPLIVTSDPGLMDAVLAVAGEAGVEVAAATEVHEALHAWHSASFVMVDADLVPTVTPRPGVVVVTRPVDDADAWRGFLNAGVEHVVELPQGAPWLYERFGRTLEETPTSGCIVVLGAVGGVGTSTLSAALAHAAFVRDGASSLVDLDPTGGGIDLVVGAETAAGARWDELSGVAGRVDERVLIQALPSLDGVTILSWVPTSAVEPDAIAIGHVLDALARDGGPVIVDAGRATDPRAHAALARARRAVVVVPLRVRGVAAAQRLIGRLPEHVEVCAVAREPAPGGLTSEDVADALGVVVAGVLTEDRRRAEVEEFGGPPPASAAWRRVSEAVLSRGTSGATTGSSAA